MKVVSVAAYVRVWLALMLLLALSLGSSYVPLGGFNTAVNLVIACAKATLVALFYMRLRSSDVLLRIAAGIGVVWFLILVGLSLTDFLARPG